MPPPRHLRAALVAGVCLLLTGCAVSAGPVIIHSPSLGFESPYVGAVVRGDIDNKRFLARAESGYYDAQKVQTGDGHGLSGSALAGAKFGRFRALGGYRWNQVETSAYTKDSAQWLAETGYAFRSGGIVAATYSLESDGSGWNSYGLRCEVPMRRVLLFSEWEHLTFDTLSGDRVALGVLWRFNR